jgi:mannose-6-phosphate isomerase-like protein (cupin superfamily)
MTQQPTIGTIFEQPGFRGEVIGYVSGLMVIDGILDGTIQPHTSDKDEFAVVTEGEIIITMTGKRLRLGVGQSIIVPAGTLHEVQSETIAKLMLIG